MKDFVKTMLASMMGVFLGMALLMVVVLLFVAGVYIKENRDVLLSEEGTGPILEIELDSEIVEKVDRSPFSFYEDIPLLSKFHKTGLYNLQKVIEQAAQDPSIEVIYLKIGKVEGGWASLSSVYESLSQFKKASKKIIAYSESYSEKGYYLASLADKIYLYPAGQFEFNGLSIVQAYFKGLWKKLNVQPQVFRVGKFKSAVEPFLQEGMSSEAKKQSNILLGDIWNQFLERIHQNRKIPKNILLSWIKEGKIQNAQDAFNGKLVDGLRAEWEVLEKLRHPLKFKVEQGSSSAPDYSAKTNSYEKERPFYKFASYLKNIERNEMRDRPDSASEIALLYVTGDIMDGKGQEGTVGSQTLVEQLRELEEDADVKAIVLRINSPGGSALAADVLWSEIGKIKKKKPIIASLGDVAASGAYYLASNCHKIFAGSNTITGSIGVFGIYMNFKGLFKDHLGVSFDSVDTGPFADLGYFHRSLTNLEKQKIQTDVDRTYQLFIERVAKGRKFSKLSQVEAVAEGRVWSGKRAKELGLIDQWGGIAEALQEAGKKAALGKNYYVKVYPQRKNAFLDMVYNFQETRMQTPWKIFSPFKTLENLDFSKIFQLKKGAFMLMPFTFDIR